MVGHTAKSCYIFKDMLKLRPEQKKVTANMSSLQFCRDLPLVSGGAIPILKEELKVINADHCSDTNCLVLSIHNMMVPMEGRVMLQNVKP